jgi:glucose-6-phosphate 1-dehydrogenase
VVEKPIGHDLAGARELDHIAREVFDEPQVFRIDHYLGKEAVQNILVFRFANSMVERAWSSDVADHVQITVAESDGIEQRGRYYEESGAMRDMVQNHLLQMLSFVAMEPRDSLAPEDVRDRKAELLEAMRPLSAGDVVGGQYTAGVVEGREVPGYRDEEWVAPESSVETFVALRAWIDNERWKDVPFFLRTGKRLPHQTTEVAIVLREPKRRLFEGTGIARLPAHHLACASSPTRASRWSSGPRSRVPGWRSTPCRWTSPTGARSRPSLRRPTSASCMTRWPAIRRSSCARTRSSGHGRSWLPSSTLQGPCTLTLRAPGARVPQTN